MDEELNDEVGTLLDQLQAVSVKVKEVKKRMRLEIFVMR